MELDGLKTAIREMAGRHGFDLCRVTRPEVSAKHADALQRWVDADMQGEMLWMGEETRMQRRTHPASMLDSVKSVVSLAMSYTPPAYSLDEACAEKDKAVITAYAHGDDYHDVMKKRLKAMARELDELLGRHDQRVFNDTAPVLEHALAEAAGLGWQGKHSLTIHRQLGSWFLLAEIFTTAEIEPDEPAVNHCGTCTACIDICPTRAIVAPYVVDARLCISYLTIEYSGFIPRELRRLMGNRIYGCDDCQLVCPWNTHANSRTLEIDDLLKPRGENHLPDLARLLRLDDDGFRQHFRKSPVKRTKRSGLLRNVCIAMGNSGHAAFIPDLIAVLGDQEPLIRGHAIWALAQLADTDHQVHILSVLMSAKEAEADDDVLEEIEVNIDYIRNKYDNT
jgi:epoxyqueuosine reductase